jgi:tryptophanyl-tRNA synthetase
MEILSEFMKPLTEKRHDLISDKAYLEKIIKMGSLKAVEVAKKTMKDVRKMLKF